MLLIHIFICKCSHLHTTGVTPGYIKIFYDFGSKNWFLALFLNQFLSGCPMRTEEKLHALLIDVIMFAGCCYKFLKNNLLVFFTTFNFKSEISFVLPSLGLPVTGIPEELLLDFAAAARSMSILQEYDFACLTWLHPQRVFPEINKFVWILLKILVIISVEFN